MEPGRHGIAILVVDDDKAIRDLLGIFINRKFPDVQLYFADNGKQGIELFKSCSAEIVITDLIMPGMDGGEMASAIMAMKSDTKLIVTTGYDTIRYLEQFPAVGSTILLTKPIDVKKLVDVIGDCIAEIEMKWH